MCVKFLRGLTAATLAIVLAAGVTACAGQSKTQPDNQADSATEGTASAEAPSTGKYNEPITVKTATNAVAVAPEGMTPTDNPYFNGWRDELNINVEYSFITEPGDNYDTKMNLLVSSDDLPDIFWVNSALFTDLQEADKIEDLTDVFDQYASERTKDYYAQCSTELAVNATVDGRLYGLTGNTGTNDFVNIIGIRTDWMKQLNLAEPKTIDDIYKIAQAFIDNNMGGENTIGMSTSQTVLDSPYQNAVLQLMNAYGAYQNIWIEKNGKLEYSGIQPEVKAALEKIAPLFQEGLFDPEFGSKNFDKYMEDANAGRSGVVFNDMFLPFRVLNGVKNEQEWGWYPIYTEKEGELAKSQVSAAFPGALVVRKGYEHPEAAVKMINFFTEKFTDDPQTYGMDGVNNFAWPYNFLMPANKNQVVHEQYVEYLNTGTMPEDATIDAKTSIETGEKYNLDKDIDGGWIMWNVFGPDGTEKWVLESSKKDAYQKNAFTGSLSSDASTKKAMLDTMEGQMIMDIIMGNKPLDSFDDFITQWKNNGGDDIATEVNEWYQKTYSK